MNLPDTQNAHHVHAFKRGYRLALEGKPLLNMPSTFRYDRTLREYFEQGWSQANEELEAGHQASLEKPWRSRIAWTVVIVIGSIATAVSMVNGIKKDQAEQQKRILSLNESPSSKSIPQNSTKPDTTLSAELEPSTAFTDDEFSFQSSERTMLDEKQQVYNTLPDRSRPPEAATKQSLASPEGQATQTTEAVTKSSTDNEAVSELSLLSNVQRQDLILNKQEQLKVQQQSVEMTPQAVIDSPITVKTALLTTNIKNKQAVDTLADVVPKQIRKLYFFTEIENAQNRTLYHRWIFKNREMALIPLSINSNLYRTWSSKQMTSAWQGAWSVEILNGNKEVIYRQSFQYGINHSID